MRNLFARLAQEEEEHIRILNLKEKHLMPVVKGKSDFFRQDLKQFISNDLNGKIFPVRKGESVEIPMIENDFEALEFGIECEKRSINLLSRLLKQERKIDVRTIFSHLVAEEKKHLTALQELQEKLPNRAA